VTVELVGGPRDGERREIQAGTILVLVPGPADSFYRYVVGDWRAWYAGPDLELAAGRDRIG
jgi:hypothetical protein